MPNYNFTEEEKNAVKIFLEHVVFIKSVRNTFNVLFENEINKYILEYSAEVFFKDIQVILINYLDLAYVRITDPYDPSNKHLSNFTIDYLYQLKKWHEPELGQLNELKRKITDFRQFIVCARNKVIAHNDLKTYLEPGKFVGGFPEGKDIEFIRNVENFLQIVYKLSFGTIYGEIITAIAGDALDLIRFLKMGVALDCMMNETEDTKLRQLIGNSIQKFNEKAVMRKVNDHA